MSAAGPSQGAHPAPAGGSAAASDLRAENRSLLIRLGVIVIAMFGFGFLLVPFYEKICEVTGIRNIAAADVPANTQVDASRTVRLELDANARGLPWTFRPLEPIVQVHPGEVRQVVYEVVNNTDHPVTGQAIPSYAPQSAAQYFRKLDCFCFAQQTLAPHERRQMPVVFVIDPAVPKDMPAITLSYTFFVVEGGTKG
jgi:cytochrome c oxidase assembly protein subunit 11